MTFISIQPSKCSKIVNGRIPLPLLDLIYKFSDVEKDFAAQRDKYVNAGKNK